MKSHLTEEQNGPQHARAQPSERGTDDSGNARRDPSNGRREEDQELTVLYVEDDPVLVELVKAIVFTRSNTTFLFAHDAESGIELAQTHCPDLILMDIRLPGMDGITAMKKLRSIEKTQQIPVIAVSGEALRADIKRAITAGFQDYIVKPFDMAELLAMIDKVSKQEPQSTEGAS